MKVLSAHESIPKGEGVEAIVMLQHGRSTCEVSKLLGISQSTHSRIYRECVPYAEPAKGGRPRSITLVQ